MLLRKIVFISYCIYPLLVGGQDIISTTFFPWVQDDQLCQINALGEIKVDTSLTFIEYPTFKTQDELDIYEDNGRYGFKDENDKVIVPAGFEQVGHFREGFTWVKLDYKRYYYLDKNGQPLIDFTFDRCYDFQNGLARVLDRSPKIGHDGYGYINQKGETVIPLQYKKAYDFVNGFALVQDKNEKWWLIDQTGKKVQGDCLGLKSRKNIFSF